MRKLVKMIVKFALVTYFTLFIMVAGLIALTSGLLHLL